MMTRRGNRKFPSGCRQRFWREEHGGALLETALVLPIALMFTFGVIQLLLFLYCYTNATYASRAAVRYAVLHGSSSLSAATTSTLSSIVTPYVSFLPASGAIVTTTWTPSNAAGGVVKVKVALSYATGIPIAGLGTLTVTTIAMGTVLK